MSNEIKKEFLPIIEELSFSSNKQGDLLDRAREALENLLEKHLKLSESAADSVN